MLNLITFNRWWEEGKVEEMYLKPFKRDLFYSLVKFLNTRQIILLYGIRRVGKTTILYQLIDYLLKNGVNKKNILYFSFDEANVSLDEVLKNYSELVLGKDILKEKKIYLFLDEIQKLKNFQNQLKVYYDLYPNIKFIVSGSASLSIYKGVKESLAGRVYEFVLPLLSFSEYLTFLGEKIEFEDLWDFNQAKEIYLKKEKLLPRFFSYIKNGGFIEIVNEEEDFKIREYSKSILEKIVFGDIAPLFKVKDSFILKTILELIGSNPGFLLDYSRLGEVLGRDQRSVANYIFYLKSAFLVRTLYNYSPSRFVSERKLKKIYLSSTNFVYQINKERFYQPDFFGKVVENLVVSFSSSSFFWKERQNEVDLVLEEKIPVEIKFKEKIDKKDLKGVLRFLQRFSSSKPLILTKEELKKEKIFNISLYFLPVWIYLLGRNDSSLI